MILCFYKTHQVDNAFFQIVKPVDQNSIQPLLHLGPVITFINIFLSFRKKWWISCNSFQCKNILRILVIKVTFKNGSIQYIFIWRRIYEPVPLPIFEINYPLCLGIKIKKAIHHQLVSDQPKTTGIFQLGYDTSIRNIFYREWPIKTMIIKYPGICL